MRIAQVAPLTEAVPPKLYGGTERVVHWLTEELVALGNEVTLFASGDSRTSGKLEATWPKALRLDGSVRDPNALHIVMLERVRQKCDDEEFDFLHFHLDYYPFSLFSRQPTPFLTTLHGRLDLPDQEYYDEIIRPMIDCNPLVEYIGEIGDPEKSDFLSGAIGLLVPIDWPEPFGLVMIEAMACGTPVIAYNRGSVAEIIDDG